MTSNVSYHFAVALLRSARKTGELKTVKRDLDEVASIIARERSVTYFLLHPGIPVARKQELLAGLAETKLVRRLVSILLETKNLGLVGQVCSLFDALVRSELGIVRARVTVAGPLGKGDREKLMKALEAATGKEVDLEMKVDPDVLAGVRLIMGDTVIDNTLRAELKMVRERLASG
jgi:F-type H+-transporting ATPase subunit delta